MPSSEKSSRKKCKLRLQGVKCVRRALTGGFCYYHTLIFLDEHQTFENIDWYYHRKVMLGLIDPAYFHTEAQNTALTTGRRHRDGRQTDDWTW